MAALLIYLFKNILNIRLAKTLYLAKIYLTTPATPLHNAHPGGFFYAQ